MFFLPGLIMVIFSPIVLKNLRDNYPITFYLSLVFLASGYSWLVFMPQHAEVHPFTVKHFGIYSAVMTGPLVIYLRQKFKDFRDEKKALKYSKTTRIFYWIIIIYCAGMAVTQQGIAVYLKNGFLHDYFFSNW